MIKVYGANNCKYCTLVKLFLASNEIEHEYNNIDTDERAKAEFDLLDVMGVPVTIAEDKMLVGWNDDVRETLAKFIK